MLVAAEQIKNREGWWGDSYRKKGKLGTKIHERSLRFDHNIIYMPEL